MFPKYSRICFFSLYLRTCAGTASCARPPPTLEPGAASGSTDTAVKQEPKEEDQTESFSSMLKAL